MPQPFSKYMIVEATDLRTGIKSFKIFERTKLAQRVPVIAGLPSRSEAEVRMRELEEQRK